MDELLSRLPNITEDILESLDDESIVRYKEASRSLLSFMDEDTELKIKYLITIKITQLIIL